MKKLLFSFAFLAFLTLSATAQRFDDRRDNNARFDDRRDNTTRDFDRRDNRGTDLSRNYEWGYDAQFNRVNRSRNASRMINSFQQQARERIAWGISRGLITGRESKRLLEFADRIEWKENRYMRNGRLSAGQAQELKQDLIVLDRMITHAKANGDRQVGGRRW